jgi:2-polyprenyl-3-methyl-5-hydroxy-6-metoxy-1,4-benzoquinol methylase
VERLARDTAAKRAPGGILDAGGILTARTLANSHPTLARLLAPGTSVLDVGCGPGTLTAEIAHRVHPAPVVGMDVNPEMVHAAEATHPPSAVPNLVFYVGDIRQSAWEGEFAIAAATRVLQWLPDPDVAVARMASAVEPGGLVVLRDYDHTRAEWTDAPAEWSTFHAAFLAWRAAGALDNAIARRLPALSDAAHLGRVVVTPEITTVRAGEPDFFRVAGTWRMVIASRGPHLVHAGYLTESQRASALDAYTAWMQEPDAALTLHETSVVARRPGTTDRSDRST